jgi:AcrR family transcriptional regulator
MAADTVAASPTSQARQGRQPLQARAVERVDRILEAARTLIAETGSEPMRMSDIAARAGIPIGSLYQYFPDKAAILRRLAELVMERVTAGLHMVLGSVETPQQALEATARMLDGYYALFLAEPAARDIWFGTQADKITQDMDIADSRRNAAIAYAALRRFVPPHRRAAFRDDCLLSMHLTGAAVRLAMAISPEEGARLMQTYKIRALDGLRLYFTVEKPQRRSQT